MTPADITKQSRTRLQNKMLARLALRWPQAHAYIPEGGNRVLCAPLPGQERDFFDTYTLGYQDAIEDMLDLLGLLDDPIGQAVALRMAENNVFQGGAPAPKRETPARYRGQRRDNPAQQRGVRQDSAARARLEALFKRGDDDDV